MHKRTSYDPWHYVRGLQETSFCDWPGKVTSVIFFGSCNLRCPTCHNKSLAWNYEGLPKIQKGKLLSFLDSKSSWLDGLVVSGGEPTYIPGIQDFLKEVKERTGLPINMHTNGTNPEVVQTLLQDNIVEMFAVDIKAPWNKYADVTGNMFSGGQAKDHLSTIFDLANQNQDNFYFRTTKVPKLTDEDIETIKSYLPEGFGLTVQEYREPEK